MNEHKNFDAAVRKALQPVSGEGTPPGFAERVMDKVRAEPLKETQGIKGWLTEYFPYAAAIAGAIALALGWQYIPWPSGLTVNTSQEAGETILQYQSLLNGFRDMVDFLSTSSIALIFFFSVGLFLVADRLFSQLGLHKKAGTLRILI